MKNVISSLVIASFLATSAFAQDVVVSVSSCKDPHLEMTLKEARLRSAYAEANISNYEEVLEGLRSDWRWSHFGAGVGLSCGSVSALIAGALGGFWLGGLAYAAGAGEVTFTIGTFTAGPKLGTAIAGAVVGAVATGWNLLKLVVQENGTVSVELQTLDPRQVIEAPPQTLSAEEFHRSALDAYTALAGSRRQVAEASALAYGEIQDRWYSVGLDSARYNRVRWDEAQSYLELAQAEARYSQVLASVVSEMCLKLQ